MLGIARPKDAPTVELIGERRRLVLFVSPGTTLRKGELPFVTGSERPTRKTQKSANGRFLTFVTGGALARSASQSPNIARP
jgi:hypothetical protein